MRWAALVLCLAVACLAAAGPSGVSAYIRVFDSDGDGRVSQAEYVAYMMRGFHIRDANGDGQLDAGEVPRSSSQRLPISAARYRRNLVRAFHRQDLDGNGYLDAREMALPPQ